MPEHLAARSYPWLGQYWEELVYRHRRAGLPHALMLTGRTGLGKGALAIQLAEWLLCQRALDTGLDQACGQCHSCQLWKAGNHPDVIACQPEEGSRQIRVDDVRKVNDFLHQTPQISQCQVVMLHPAEVLNTNAANALLKTLEEPSGESFILLQSERFGSVLPTIRSRCQRVDLKTPEMSHVIRWVMDQGFTEEQAGAALARVNGSPLQALAWLEKDMGRTHESWMQGLLAWTSGRSRLAELVEGWKKEELEEILHWLVHLCTDLMKLQLGADAPSIGDSTRQLSALKVLDKNSLLTVHDKAFENLSLIRSGISSINRQLLLESLMIDWREMYR